MTSKSFSVNGPGSPFQETVMIVLSKINFVVYVLVGNGIHLENK